MSNSHRISKIHVPLAKFPWAGTKETQRTIFLATTLAAQHRREGLEAACLVPLASRWISVLCVFLHVSEMEND